MGDWQRIHSKIAYKNSWYQIREDSVITDEGKPATFCIVERKPSVFIVPVTEQQETFLIKIYRYTTDITAWEVPGGGTMADEEIIDAAKRELQEETGIIARHLEIAATFQCANGISNQMAYSVIAKELDLTRLVAQHEEGIETIKKVPLADIFSLIESNEISDGQSIIALTHAALKLGLMK